MGTVTLSGNPVRIQGELPKVGVEAPEFILVTQTLEEVKLSGYKGKKVLLNIFPSLDTSVCATSMRKFNERAAALPNTVVLAISKDLPFAFGRFCSTEGIANVIGLSAFRDQDFAKEYGVGIIEGPLKGVFARSVVVLDEKGKVIYRELVPEITNEPDYEAAIKAIKG